MSTKQKEVIAPEKILFNITYGLIIGFILIFILHVFQEKWNSYNPIDATQNYWFIHCPLDNNSIHKGGTGFLCSFLSPFSHWILWIFIAILITLFLQFSQTTKIVWGKKNVAAAFWEKLINYYKKQGIITDGVTIPYLIGAVGVLYKQSPILAQEANKFNAPLAQICSRAIALAYLCQVSIFKLKAIKF